MAFRIPDSPTTLGRLASQGPPPRSSMPSDTKGTLSSNSRTPPTSTVHAIPTTSLVTVMFLTWYVRWVLLVWRCLCAPPQVGALLDDYPNIFARATDFDNKVISDAFAVTPQNSDYKDVVALSVRQLFGSIELTVGWDGLTGRNDTMAFLRGTWFACRTLESMLTLTRWSAIRSFIPVGCEGLTNFGEAYKHGRYNLCRVAGVPVYQPDHRKIPFGTRLGLSGR